MVEVQDKSAPLVAHRTTGSVPVVLPSLTAAITPTVPSLAACANELFSITLIVVLPTLFWCAIISAVRSLIGLETSFAALSFGGLLIAGFLLIVRASLMIDRSA
jgi:hypothetical protein